MVKKEDTNEHGEYRKGAVNCNVRETSIVDRASDPR